MRVVSRGRAVLTGRQKELPTPCSQLGEPHFELLLQSCLQIHLLCFKPLSVGEFAPAAVGNQYPLHSEIEKSTR